MIPIRKIKNYPVIPQSLFESWGPAKNAQEIFSDFRHEIVE